MDLKQQFDLTYMFISHDLNVVQFVSDRVLVMYLGQVVEVGPVDAIYNAPMHPYTRALLDSRLSMDPDVRIDDPPLTGDPPNPISPPSGCRFRTRCPHAQDICGRETPVLPSVLTHAVGHLVACHMYDSASGHTEASPPPAQSQAKPARVPVQARDARLATTDALADATTLTAANPCEPLVEVRDLNVTFVSREASVHAANDVSFTLMPGEVMCLIGESGSGKSVTLRAMMRLFPSHQTVMTGDVRIAGCDMMALSMRQLSDIRGTTVAMIFQEPMTALDPVYTVGRQIAETVVRHDGCSAQDAWQRALDLLDVVKVPSAKRRLHAYPHELSGGLRQRAMIAMALSCRPRLLLADEPTTALDATVQIQVLTLLRQLQEDLGMGIIFVTHDIGVAAEIADHVAVMYAGRIVEQGRVRDVLHRPLHPYAEGMLSSSVSQQPRGTRIEAIPGSPPDLRQLPQGCSFAPRCRYVTEACAAAVPAARLFEDGRMARCIHVS
jgi:peptide/nickel transport system ATP-binding protein